MDKEIEISVKSRGEALLDGSYAFWPFAFTGNDPEFVLNLRVRDLFYRHAFNGVEMFPLVLCKVADVLKKNLGNEEKIEEDGPIQISSRFEKTKVRF